MDKDSFVFYRSFYEAIKEVPKKHRSVIYEAVFEYVFDAQEPSLSGVPSAMWKLIKPQLDASAKRYENSKKGAEYGKLGGRPKKTKEDEKPLKGSEEKPLKGKEAKTPNVNVNVNENDNENVNVNVSRVRARNTRPSAQELAIYCFENGIHTNLEKFMSYNDAKGWPIEWKAALAMWVEKDKEKQQAPKTSSGSKWSDYEQREVTDWDEEERKLLGY